MGQDMLKVFSHCPNLKMWKFSITTGQTNSTHSCLYNGMGFLYPYPISIRVWGIASFTVVKVFPQPSTW